MMHAYEEKKLLAETAYLQAKTAKLKKELRWYEVITTLKGGVLLSICLAIFKHFL